MYIINTDQGYITKGLPHEGLMFGLREDAKQFTYDDIESFGNYTAAELKEYYLCEEVLFEQI